MDFFQHTVSKSLTFKGIGLHSGNPVKMIIEPAAPHSGVLFRRIDLTGCPDAEASLENVSDTSRGTTLTKNDVAIATIEHLMAALFAANVTNVSIKLDGPEIPILDGSSNLFYQEIINHREKQESSLPSIAIEKSLQFVYKKSTLSLSPNSKFEISVDVNYPGETITRQIAAWSEQDDFGIEVAPARTFCFYDELMMLQKQNLIKGGSSENAMIFTRFKNEKVDDAESSTSKIFASNEEGLINTTLRFTNEPARHKLLDAVGDLSLISAHIKGKIHISSPGHEANVYFARKILEHISSKTKNPNLEESL